MRNKQNIIPDAPPDSSADATVARTVEKRRLSEFMVACASGNLDRVRQMLADGSDPNYVSDLGGTPLTWAVAWDRKEVVECLLCNGADVNLPARPAWSALMHAASRGNAAIVSVLIAHGADLFRRDNDGTLAVELANGAGASDCAFLIEQSALPSLQGIRCASETRSRSHSRGHRKPNRGEGLPPVPHRKS